MKSPYYTVIYIIINYIAIIYIIPYINYTPIKKEEDIVLNFLSTYRKNLKMSNKLLSE